jgi:hypothetical protein
LSFSQMKSSVVPRSPRTMPLPAPVSPRCAQKAAVHGAVAPNTIVVERAT